METLIEKVVPLYYQPRCLGAAPGVDRLEKNAFRTLAWRFNADRMVMDYARRSYLPAAGGVSCVMPGSDCPVRLGQTRRNEVCPRFLCMSACRFWVGFPDVRGRGREPGRQAGNDHESGVPRRKARFLPVGGNLGLRRDGRGLPRTHETSGRPAAVKIVHNELAQREKSSNGSSARPRSSSSSAIPTSSAGWRGAGSRERPTSPWSTSRG